MEQCWSSVGIRRILRQWTRKEVTTRKMPLPCTHRSTQEPGTDGVRCVPNFLFIHNHQESVQSDATMRNICVATFHGKRRSNQSTPSGDDGKDSRTNGELGRYLPRTMPTIKYVRLHESRETSQRADHGSLSRQAVGDRDESNQAVAARWPRQGDIRKVCPRRRQAYLDPHFQYGSRRANQTDETRFPYRSSANQQVSRRSCTEEQGEIGSMFFFAWVSHLKRGSVWITVRSLLRIPGCETFDTSTASSFFSPVDTGSN